MPPPPLPPPAPAHALEAFRQRSISTAALARALVAHPTWSVPVSRQVMEESFATGAVSAVMSSRDDQGRNSLYVFSDAGAYGAYQVATGVVAEQLFVTVPGAWICGLPLENFDYLVFDPELPRNCTFPRGSYDSLRHAAAALRVEAALREGSSPSPEGVATIRNYQDYLLVSRRVNDEKTFLELPNAAGESCLVVCTATDAFESLTAVKPDVALGFDAVGGELLFEMTSPDPLIVNPAGQAGPIEVPGDFYQFIL